MTSEYSFQAAFEARDDLKVYGSNALMLFALEILTIFMLLLRKL